MKLRRLGACVHHMVVGFQFILEYVPIPWATKISAELNVWTRVGVGTEIDLRVNSSIAYSADRDPLRRVWLNPLVGKGA